MYSFIISIVILLLGYFVYGRFIEKVFGPDSGRKTPAITKSDGVDYVPMPSWKVFMIQFLNIAGTGPIFGAIMGAKFGPSCYIWIVFGCIFAGAVHDYFTGMLSMRNGGANIPDLIWKYIGRRSRAVMLVFSIVLLLLVGTVFVYSPALIIGDMAAPFSDPQWSVMFWVLVIFAYYIIATLLPIDKLIGRVYPLFAFALLFMAFGLMVCLFVKWPSIPEIWDGLQNRGPELGMNGQAIFPCLFITIACGAISGFHSTQSPMMARCLTNERQGRPIFYGAMITEGLVALIWAAVSSYFFFDGGMQEVGATGSQAPQVVIAVSKSWLGIVGGILAILGVVAAPITSGDTAFRSARLIIADFMKVNQSKKMNRLMVSLPIFVCASLLLWFNVSNSDGFNIIWRYFGWANQTLAALVLWMETAYLIYGEYPGSQKPYYLVTMIPAAFMTGVSISFIAVDKTGFNLPASTLPYLAAGAALVSIVIFQLMLYRRKQWLKNGGIRPF